MLQRILPVMLVAMLALPAVANAFGAAHVGATRVGPAGVTHTGATVHRGPAGVTASHTAVHSGPVGTTAVHTSSAAGYHYAPGYAGVATRGVAVHTTNYRSFR